MKDKIEGSRGAAIEGTVEGLFAIITAESFHNKLGKEDRVKYPLNTPLGAADCGGQTNQFAQQKGAGACVYSLKDPITNPKEPQTPNKAEYGTSKDEKTWNNKTQCSQSAMWGLNAFGDGQVEGQDKHQTGMMNAITGNPYVENMLVYVLGRQQGPWKTCFEYTECKKYFEEDINTSPKLIGGFIPETGIPGDDKKPGVPYLKNCTVKHYDDLATWWNDNVSSKEDEKGTPKEWKEDLRGGGLLSDAKMKDDKRINTKGIQFSGGTARLAMNHYNTLKNLYNLTDDQKIVPCDSPWNEGAALYMDKKVGSVIHAGGDANAFDAFFNQLTVALGGHAGGDKAKSLEERVAALEEGLNQKAGGG